MGRVSFLNRKLHGQFSHSGGAGIRPCLHCQHRRAMTLVPKGYFWTAGFCGLTCHASVGPDNKHFARDYLRKP